MQIALNLIKRLSLYAEYGGGNDHSAALGDIPHDLRRILDLPMGTPPDLVGTASALLEVVALSPEASVPHSAARFGQVILGPRQMQLFTQLEQAGFKLEIASAFRSHVFQSLLFANAYLTGTLFDDLGRLTVALPGTSDHEVLDGAIDIYNWQDLYVWLKANRIKLPCSLVRPFLAANDIAYEPWHWRTMYGSRSSEDGFNPCWEAIENFTTPLTIENLVGIDISDNDNSCQQHVVAFAELLHNDQTGCCVGSRFKNAALALQDALSAVGSHNSFSYATFAHGYTPVYNGHILPEDLGQHVFRLYADSGLDAYITPIASSRARIFRPREMLDSLEEKAKIDPGERYWIEKSRTSEAVLDRRGDLMAFAAWGRPYPNIERIGDIPSLLIRDYIEWIIRRGAHGPWYEIDPVRGRVTRTVSPSHLAFSISRLVFFIDDEPRILPFIYIAEKRLRAHLLSADCTGSSATSQSSDLQYVAVFFLQFLLNGGRTEEAVSLAKEFESLWAYGTNEYSPDFFLLGHLCDFLASLSRHDFTFAHAQFNRLCGQHDFREMIEAHRAPSVHSAAIAMMLRAVATFSQASESTAHALAAMLLRTPSSVIAFEDGAWDGMENFQSALAAEALLSLCESQLVPFEWIEMIRDRIQAALKFLRVLQFPSGSNLLSTQSIDVEGSVPYSLLDCTVRCDFGVHAVDVARRFMETEDAAV